MSAAPPRPDFYRYRESDSLDNYVHEQITTRLTRRRTELLDERNMHTYIHGNRWTVEATDSPSEMHSMSAEATVHSMDIIDHNTGILETHISSMVEQLYAGLMKHLYETVGKAAEAVGNTVGRDDHHGDIPIGFLAMLEKIEFGVDRYGSANDRRST